MIITLRFTLPEDKDAFDSSYRGPDWKDVVAEIDELLRQDNKHGTGKMTSQKVRNALWEAIRERHLNLHD